MLQKFLKLDWILLFSILALVGISLISLYSLSHSPTSNAGENFFIKQLIFSCIGIAIMFMLAFFDYHYFQSSSRLIYFATFFALLAVILIGKTVNGTSGWIGIGTWRVQPVEFSKIAMIIFLASFISKKKTEIGEAGQLIGSLVLTMVIIFLVLKQPDLGSTMVLISIWLGMIILSGINKKVLASILIVGCLISVSAWHFLAPYQKDRIINLVQPEVNRQGSGYNAYQAMVAVGSGGLSGKGIGQGSQSQLNFLPEKQTDFIFALISEEWGLLGSLLVLLLYSIIFFRIKRIADAAPDNFSYLVALGILLMIFAQFLINVGMNIGIAPVTGIPLPFLSYGGSSLLSMFIGLGLLMNIYLKRDITISRVMESY
jgi:rod shape determining protein RodA